MHRRRSVGHADRGKINPFLGAHVCAMHIRMQHRAIYIPTAHNI